MAKGSRIKYSNAECELNQILGLLRFFICIYQETSFLFMKH